MRSVLRRSFAPAVIEGLRPVVAEEVAAALGAIVTGEPVDVVAAFTRPVPFRVVARLLGLPRAAWAELEALAHAASTDDTATEDFAGLRARLLAERDMMRLLPRAPRRAGRSEEILPVLRAAVAEAGDHPARGRGSVSRGARRRLGLGRPPARGRAPGDRSSWRARGSRRVRRGAPGARAAVRGLLASRHERHGARRRRDRGGRPRRTPLRAAQRVRRPPPELRPRHPLLPRRGARATRGAGRAGRGARRDVEDRGRRARSSGSPHPRSTAIAASWCGSALERFTGPSSAAP